MKRRIAIGLLIGAAALTLALWGVPLGDLGRALADADVRWLLPAGAVFLCQQVLRSWRQLILLRAVQPRLRFRSSLMVLCVSFFFINTLPARLGEVVRPTLLWEREDVPVGGGFALVFLERVIDLSATICMVVAVAWWVPVHGAALQIGGRSLDWVALGRTAATTALPVLLGGLVAVLVGGRALVGAVERRALVGPAWWRRLVGVGLRFAWGFVEGLEALRSPRRLAGVLVITAATWSMSGLIYVFAARAFELQSIVGYGQSIGVMAITMLGTVIPSAPGFAGTYEAFFRGGLALFGASGPGLDARAVAMALTVHWWIYGVQSCTAIYFLVVDRIDPRAVWEKAVAGWRAA